MRLKTMAKWLLALLGAALLDCASARLPWLHTKNEHMAPWNASAIEVIETHADKKLPCENLVEKAPVVFPKELMLSKQKDFGMYSGYVNVTREDYLFYWFVEATRNEHRTDAETPLIIWSNGGPGCSGMEGATTEHGPFVLHDVKENSRMFTGRLSHNPYSWNERAHVLYVDQPRYVGFSCGTGPMVRTSEEAGKDLVQFLLGWQRLFPEHRGRNIIFASESYGGKYMGGWVNALHEYNEKVHESAQLPLKGIALGNAIVDEEIQNLESFLAFQKRHDLIPQDANPKSDGEARQLMKKHLGYSPNYYNYGLMDMDCCGCYSYNYSTWGEWLMKKEVGEALNVCGDAGKNTFGGCHGGCIEGIDDFDKHDKLDHVGILNRALKSGIKVTMFYGMMDTACNYVGGYNLANSLEWDGAKDFQQASLVDLKIGGTVAGASQSAGGLTWVQIMAAGHMVEADNPAASTFAIDTLILEINSPTQDLEAIKTELAEGLPASDHADWPRSVPKPRWVLLTLGFSVIFASGAFFASVVILRPWRRSASRPEDDGYIRVAP